MKVVKYRRNVDEGPEEGENHEDETLLRKSGELPA